MGNSIKNAFEQIRAEDELKQKTQEYVLKKAKNYPKYRTSRSSFKAIATCCICLILFVFVGHWIYFTPTSEINIDINPSLGLGINRFNQVVKVEGLNSDGLDLANQLNVKYENYEEAIQKILNNKTIEDLLAKDNKIVITVTGSDSIQSQEIYTEIETNASGLKNTSCHHISNEEAKKAHDLGLSYGKYQAYLELIALDDSYTPEEIQGMTMMEIQDLINSLSSQTTPPDNSLVDNTNNQTPTQDSQVNNGNSQENGHHGYSHQNGHHN